MTSIGDIPKTLDDRAKGRGKARYVGTSPTVVWTLWSYLGQPSVLLSAQLVDAGVPLGHHHNSGRAYVDCVARPVDAFSTSPVVPIHSEGTDCFTNNLLGVEARADQKWWEL